MENNAGPIKAWIKGAWSGHEDAEKRFVATMKTYGPVKGMVLCEKEIAEMLDALCWKEVGEIAERLAEKDGVYVDFCYEAALEEACQNAAKNVLSGELEGHSGSAFGGAMAALKRTALRKFISDAAFVRGG